MVIDPTGSSRDSTSRAHTHTTDGGGEAFERRVLTQRRRKQGQHTVNKILGGPKTHWHLRHITQHSRPHTRAAAAEGVLLWPSSALPSLHLHAPVDTQAKNKTLAAAVAHPKKEKEEEEDDFDSWPPLRQTGSSTIDPIRASTTHTQMLLLLLLYIQTQDTERETNDDDSW